MPTQRKRAMLTSRICARAWPKIRAGVATVARSAAPVGRGAVWGLRYLGVSAIAVVFLVGIPIQILGYSSLFFGALKTLVRWASGGGAAAIAVTGSVTIVAGDGRASPRVCDRPKRGHV